VPGTHDVQLGMKVLSALTRPGNTAVPRFDKSRDDRCPESAWPVVHSPCDVVLFEGLWIGLPAMDDATLREPINALEAREDPHAVWRRHANRGRRPVVLDQVNQALNSAQGRSTEGVRRSLYAVRW